MRNIGHNRGLDKADKTDASEGYLEFTNLWETLALNPSYYQLDWSHIRQLVGLNRGVNLQQASTVSQGPNSLDEPDNTAMNRLF